MITNEGMIITMKIFIRLLFIIIFFFGLFQSAMASLSITLIYPKNGTYTVTGKVDRKEWKEVKHNLWKGTLQKLNSIRFHNKGNNEIKTKGFYYDIKNNKYYVRIEDGKQYNNNGYVYMYGFEKRPPKLIFKQEVNVMEGKTKYIKMKKKDFYIKNKNPDNIKFERLNNILTISINKPESNYRPIKKIVKTHDSFEIDILEKNINYYKSQANNMLNQVKKIKNELEICSAKNDIEKIQRNLKSLYNNFKTLKKNAKEQEFQLRKYFQTFNFLPEIKSGSTVSYLLVDLEVKKKNKQIYLFRQIVVICDRDIVNLEIEIDKLFEAIEIRKKLEDSDYKYNPLIIENIKININKIISKINILNKEVDFINSELEKEKCNIKFNEIGSKLETLKRKLTNNEQKANTLSKELRENIRQIQKKFSPELNNEKIVSADLVYLQAKWKLEMISANGKMEDITSKKIVDLKVEIERLYSKLKIKEQLCSQ